MTPCVLRFVPEVNLYTVTSYRMASKLLYDGWRGFLNSNAEYWHASCSRQKNKCGHWFRIFKRVNNLYFFRKHLFFVPNKYIIVCVLYVAKRKTLQGTWCFTGQSPPSQTVPRYHHRHHRQYQDITITTIDSTKISPSPLQTVPRYHHRHHRLPRYHHHHHHRQYQQITITTTTRQ